MKKLKESFEEIKKLRLLNESNKSLDGILECQKEKYLSEIAMLKEQLSEKEKNLIKQSEEYTQLYIKHIEICKQNTSSKPVSCEKQPTLAGKRSPLKSNGRGKDLREFIIQSASKKKCLFENIQS